MGLGGWRPWGAAASAQAHVLGEARSAMVEAKGVCLAWEDQPGWPRMSAMCVSGRVKGILLWARCQLRMDQCWVQGPGLPLQSGKGGGGGSPDAECGAGPPQAA